MSPLPELAQKLHKRELILFVGSGIPFSLWRDSEITRPKNLQELRRIS